MKVLIVEDEKQLVKSVSNALRQEGYVPYRVRFDESQAAWIVSSLVSRRATV